MGSRDVTLSVALTTCNGCPFIGPQLASIAAQTRPPDELIIGDDRSDDDTALVAERFAVASTIPTHVQRNPTRLGVARNFEQVVRRCRGDIVVFSDQDDVWMPHRLGAIEAALRAAPDASGVFSNGLFIDERGAALPGTLFDRCAFGVDARRHFRAGRALAELVRRNVVTGATLAVRRSALLPLLPFDAFWPHDYDMALGLSVLGRLLVIDAPLIRYRLHARQQIGFPAKSLRGMLQVVRRQNATACAQESLAFERLCLRLMALGLDAHAPAIEVLRGKRRLLAERAEMRTRRRRAPALMWRGLREGGYREFTVGWKQLVVDLAAVALNAEQRALPHLRV